MKKAIVFLFIVTLAVMPLFAVGSSQSSGSTSSKGVPEVPASNLYGVKRIVNNPITIKIFAPKDPQTPPYDELENFKKYSEYTGVNVIWEQPTFNTQMERFNIILASQDLPDMFWNIDNRQNVIVSLRAANAIVPLQKYFNRNDAPLFRKVVDEHPETLKAFMEPNGDIWFLPFFDGLATNDPCIVRGDWLDKLGMPLPVTKDDWVNFWRAVRDHGRELNGKDTIIPLGTVSTNSVNGFRSWVSLWGMLDTFYVDVKDGYKVKFANIEPKYKEFLEWAKMLYDENLLDKEFANTGSGASSFATKNAQNLVASWRGKLNGNFNSYLVTMGRDIPGYKLYGTEPPKASDGTQLHPGVANFVRYDTVGGVVTAASKYPAECVKYCDWFYDPTPPYGGAFINLFGFEGITFDFTSPDKTTWKYSDWVMKNPDGLSADQALLRYTNRGQQPAYNPPTSSFLRWEPLTFEAYNRVEPFYKASLEYKCENLPFTDAENREIRSKMADITTYVDETINRFIMGREPLSNFDNYVATVKRMGIDDILKIYNDAYAKWNAPRPAF